MQVYDNYFNVGILDKFVYKEVKNMRMKLYFTLENERMPIDYRRSIISFIKLSLSEYSENEFKKYYNQKDNIIKPYAFSVFFVLFDCITIFLTGLVGLTANLRLYKERKCSGSFAALNSVCQFVFCIDVISAVIVYICSRKEPVQ